MVTVIDFAVRTNSGGENFVALILEGDIEMVQSNQTGRYYATAKRCSITSTFTESVVKQLIGKQIPGSIIREKCEVYEYKIPETGELIELNHRYVFSPLESGETKPGKIASPMIPQPGVYSSNGQMVAEA